MSKHPALLFSVIAIALGVAACGGSSNSSSSAGSTSSTGASSHLTLMAMSNGQLMFDKKSLTAKSGTVTIAFTNTSPEQHNLTIQKGTSGAVVGATPTFNGGTKTLTVKLTSGTYTFYCSVPGHRQAGMQGTLTVT
jgi:plastocyanin